MKNLSSHKVYIVFSIFSCYLSVGQIYFPTASSKWENKNPKEYDISLNKLSKAISFAQSNEYSGEKELRIAILKGFSKEPYHKILGPTKKRGKPSGIILKNGYQILFWGDTKRVDMTFSVTKSYLSTVAGLAVDRRFFKTKDLVKNLIWDNKFDGKHNSKITWAHLLNQSSDWAGNLWGIDDWGDRPPEIGETTTILSLIILNSTPIPLKLPFISSSTVLTSLMDMNLDLKQKIHYKNHQLKTSYFYMHDETIAQIDYSLLFRQAVTIPCSNPFLSAQHIRCVHPFSTCIRNP